jgi:hypothetical protein
MNGTRPDHEGGLRASSIRPWNEFGGRPAPWCAPRRSERTEPVFPGMVRRGKGDVHADSTVGGFCTAVPAGAARMRSARSTERMRQSAASRGGGMRPRNGPATWIAAVWGIARERGWRGAHHGPACDHARHHSRHPNLVGRGARPSSGQHRAVPRRGREERRETPSRLVRPTHMPPTGFGGDRRSVPMRNSGERTSGACRLEAADGRSQATTSLQRSEAFGHGTVRLA